MIFNADKTKLINIKTQLEYVKNLKRTKKNRNGEHCEDCVWSNEN